MSRRSPAPLWPHACRALNANQTCKEVWKLTGAWLLQVSLLYTAPTAIRALQSFGDSFVTKYSRKSLRILGTVGEPINPEAWKWYHEVIFLLFSSVALALIRLLTAETCESFAQVHRDTTCGPDEMEW